MNALTPTPDDQAQTTLPDENAVGEASLDQAKNLKSGDAAGARMVVEYAIINGMSEAFDEVFIKAIANSTGLKQKFFSDMLRRLRAAPSSATPKPGAAAAPSFGIGNPEPATNPKPLAQLLDNIVVVIKRQVVCPPHVAHAVALWIVATYGLCGAFIFPRLAITSAAKRCGKSTLLAVICTLASNPYKSDNVTASSVFRLLSLGLFTLIIDEVDAFFRVSDDLRGVVNASHERTGTILRTVSTPDGKGHTVAEFKVFCAMVLSGIGGLPDTVLDRSIIIKLERAPSRGCGNRRPPVRHRKLADLRDIIAPHLVAWAPSIEAALERGAKAFPAGLSDRAQDNWDAPLAVAELAGSHWPQRGLDAAQTLSGGDDAQSQREMLLADLRQTVTAARAAWIVEYRAWVQSGRKGARPIVVHCIRSTDFVGDLVQLEHRPWPEYGKDGRGLSAHRLASLLKPFGIEPKKQRMPVRQAHALSTTATESVRVYSVPALRRAFRQYLS